MRANIAGLPDAVEDNLVKGLYEAEVTKVEHTVSDRTGTEGTTLTFKILDGPDTEQGDPSQGRTLVHTMWWPHSGMKDGGKFSRVQLKKACEAANVALDETGFDEEDFEGAVVNIRVKLEEYEGEFRPRVATIQPA